jgi:hypothetical protein
MLLRRQTRGSGSKTGKASSSSRRDSSADPEESLILSKKWTRQARPLPASELSRPQGGQLAI